jgi:hypothetical protein
MRAPRRDLTQDLGWGIFWGLAFAVVLTVVLVLLHALRRSALFEAHNTTFGGVVAVYFGGGLTGGVVLGLLRPLTRWRSGAAMVGVLAAMPVGVAVRVLRFGLAPWGPKDTIALVVFAVALGGSVGWIYWGMFRSDMDKKG